MEARYVYTALCANERLCDYECAAKVECLLHP